VLDHAGLVFSDDIEYIMETHRILPTTASECWFTCGANARDEAIDDAGLVRVSRWSSAAQFCLVRKLRTQKGTDGYRNRTH